MVGLSYTPFPPPFKQPSGVTAPLIDLLSLRPVELRSRLDAHFAELGQPRFRAKQVVKWILEKRAPSFETMTDLPAGERAALADVFVLAEPELAVNSVSTDGTEKQLWRLDDGELIESVLIPTPTRRTLCISSQAGCAMGCTFCSTGWGGFRRQLTAGEIVSQFRAVARTLAERGEAPITNLVFMGMGEPMANRKALFPALEILNAGYGLGARRITVSTVGHVPGILELADRPEQFGLALSLHSPRSDLRRELIPLEQRYPIEDVMDALEVFNRAGGRRITFEYTMIRDVNDDPDLVPELATLARRVRAFVNLIPFNPIPDQSWGPSIRTRIEAFEQGLMERGVDVAVRVPRGRDIAAACGQLRVQALPE